MRPLTTTRAGALAALVLLTSFAGGQRGKLPPNHPSNDPYTLGGDAKAMEQAGILSHGGFEFGAHDTAKAEEMLPGTEIRWVETEHFEIGFALGPYKVTVKEKKQFLAELTALKEFYPTIEPKTKVLDPWLRTHMFAHRCERLYDKFLELVGHEDSEFPDGNTPWDLTGTYMGQGPHLGMKGKFELLVLPNETSLKTFLREQFGLSTSRSQRWHVIDKGSLISAMQERQGSLRNDTALHGHVAFHFAIHFLDGYRHYSYDPPIWLREGLGHLFERQVSPKYNTFDADEGGTEVVTKKSDWKAPVRKLANSSKAPRMAELARLRTFSEMTLDEHYAVWSWVDFLTTAHPDEFRQFLDVLKGRTNAEGYPDGSKLDEAHRVGMKEIFGWSYAQFDDAWKVWVSENY